MTRQGGKFSVVSCVPTASLQLTAIDTEATFEIYLATEPSHGVDHDDINGSTVHQMNWVVARG